MKLFAVQNIKNYGFEIKLIDESSCNNHFSFAVGECYSDGDIIFIQYYDYIKIGEDYYGCCQKKYWNMDYFGHDEPEYNIICKEEYLTMHKIFKQIKCATSQKIVKKIYNGEQYFDGLWYSPKLNKDDIFDDENKMIINQY
jgi:hypothetical protein